MAGTLPGAAEQAVETKWQFYQNHKCCESVVELLFRGCIGTLRRETRCTEVDSERLASDKTQPGTGGAMEGYKKLG